MTQDSILGKINALLNKTVENGASEAEADAALAMAQKLMAKHMIEESQLAEHAKDRKCQKVEVPMFKTGYDTDAINDAIAKAFDCKCWWNRGKERVYFFGFGDDAKLAAYFYNYLNNAIVNEAEKYRKTLDYVEQKIMGYNGRSIMASFRKGMMARLVTRLKELKASRVANVVQATGTDLVVVKEDQVRQEYDGLNLKLKTKNSNWDYSSPAAFDSGVESANKVNMAGGLEQQEERKALA